MTLRLFRQGHQTGLERAGCVDHADQAAEHQDEHHDVDAVDRAGYHCLRDIGDALGLSLKLLVGAGDRNGLRDGPAGELLDVDLHAELIEFVLRSGNLAQLALRARDREHIGVGHVLKLGVLSCRHEPRCDNRDDGQGEQDGERCWETKLLLPLLLLHHGPACGVDGSGLGRHMHPPFMEFRILIRYSVVATSASCLAQFAWLRATCARLVRADPMIARFSRISPEESWV